MPDPLSIQLRPAADIQAAHDRLVAILIHDIPNPFGDDGFQSLSIAAAVLCWVLQHDHNTAFGENLAQIDQELRNMGYELKDSGRLQPGRESK
jgi:hypothetical protein